MSRLLPLIACALLFTACEGMEAPVAGLEVGEVLASGPEPLEFLTPEARQSLYAQLILASRDEDGLPAQDTPVLFVMGTDEGLLGAPALPASVDLLQTPASADRVAVRLDADFRQWPDERCECLQGLSEREAAELVARSLLWHWELEVDREVVVERAVGAPYAAAWIDGILRLNPALLYLASAPGLRAGPASALSGR
ncbi:MAG TPA: hypothetical protein VK013_05170 [Myxococcaceae bacterium]|nr:hypothetical protein [Myxococcaceae bacterium]